MVCAGPIATFHFLLATRWDLEDFEPMFSSILLTRQSVCCAAAALVLIPSVSAASEEEMAAQIAALEKRLAQLESRLSVNEKKTKEAKVLATNTSTANRGAGNNSTLNILSNSAWRDLRWTEEDQWKTVVNGASMQQVEDALGKPPRSVKSLKPRIDMVYFYETKLGDKHGLSGKVSFKKGKVVSVIKPDFSKNLSGN